MKKIIIVLAIFFLDRVTKIYLLNLQESGTNIDFYVKLDCESKGKCFAYRNILISGLVIIMRH